MSGSIHGIINCSFAWLIVLLSIAGYVLTVKRMGQGWLFWVVLATGWTLLAIAQTLLLAQPDINRSLVAVLSVMSYVLMVCSLVLIFLKLATLKQASGAGKESSTIV